MKNKVERVEFLRMLLAIFISLFIVVVIIFMVSKSPVETIMSFLTGPLKSVRRFGNVIELMVPLIFSGLSIIFLFRTGLFNLSGEGAIFVGAVVSTAVVLTLKTNPFVSLIIAMLLSGVFGAIVTFIPGFLKVKFNANEIVTSLMLNFVCLNVGLFVIQQFFLDPNINSPYSYAFNEAMQLPRLIKGTRIHAGVFIAIIFVILSWVILNRTKFGLKSKIVGANSMMGKYVGINSFSIIILTQLIGGFIAGLGGSIELFGMFNRFQYSGLTGYGWDGIPIAIIAAKNPKYVPFAALFFSYLKIGADIMARESDIPFEIVQIIQAIMIVFISAQALLSGYRKKVMMAQIQEMEGAKND